MTVALRSPRLVKALVPVDNAPVDANLKSNFHQYVRGLREVEESAVKKQAEADEILKGYEKVSIDESSCSNIWLTSRDCSGARYQTVPLNESHTLGRWTASGTSHSSEDTCY